MRFATEESFTAIFPMSLHHPRLQLQLQQLAVTVAVVVAVAAVVVWLTFTTFIRDQIVVLGLCMVSDGCRKEC
jgi:hypothetical protein